MVWKCKSCSYTNQDCSDNCNVCYKLKEVSPYWKCEGCHNNNGPNNYVCICNRKAPFFGKWCCEKCNLFNDLFNLNCNACDHKNEHLKVCEMCHLIMVNTVFNKLCDKCRNKGKILRENFSKHKNANEKNNGDRKYNLHNNFKKMNIGTNDNNNNNNVQYNGQNNINRAGKVFDEPKRSDSRNRQQKYTKCEKCHCSTTNVDIKYCDNCLWICKNSYCDRQKNRPTYGYCFRCSLQKDIDPKPYGKSIWINHYEKKTNQRKPKETWQCSYCGAFVFVSKKECFKCECPRNYANTMNICPCKWVNPKQNDKCEKCSWKF